MKPTFFSAKHFFLSWSRNFARIVLVLGLLTTAIGTFYMKSIAERIAEQNFIAHCNEIHQVIANRLGVHVRILMSGAAFFNASEAMTREKWRVFNQRQNFEKQLPGIQGIGFSLLIPHAELARHIQQIRGEGFSEYKVRPDGDRQMYSSIIYLEPFSGRNLRAFGYDMLSESVRRKAMERARDTGGAALSGVVVLVQETDSEIQAGTLMYVPVYHKGMPIDSVAERRAAIMGWVYSPYRMGDLMRGMLGHFDFKKERLHLKVFDGAEPSPQGLLCEAGAPESGEARFTQQSPVDFNGQRWTLLFTQKNDGFMTPEYTAIWVTFVSGVLITFLMFVLIGFLRLRADTADKKAAEIQAAYKELKETQALLVQAEKLAAIGVLSAGVAHELNNPLTGILALARDHVAHDHPNDKDSDYRDIVTAGERMAGIVKGLLDFSKPSRGEIKELSCNDVIHEILAFTNKTMMGSDVDVQMNLDRDLPLVKADKNQLEQISIIIMGNAVDAMQKKGVLEISTRVVLIRESQFVEMEFTDSGCGIKEEDRDRIFDPFFTTKRPGKGTGLGLSVALSIIKENNGEILVESPPAGREQGASFKVRLPAVAGA